MRTVAEVKFYALLLEACNCACKVRIQRRLPNGDLVELEGEARHIVQETYDGFVHGNEKPSLDHRLRITGTFDYFIPLVEITAVSIDWESSRGNKRVTYMERPEY